MVNQEVRNFIDEVMKGSAEEVLERYISMYIPNRQLLTEAQREDDKAHPLYALVPTILLDDNNVPIAEIKKEDADKKLALFTTKFLFSVAGVMHEHVNTMKEVGIYTNDVLVTLFSSREIVPESHTTLLERGLKAYFEDDYIVACSLLVPQFEAAVRQLATSLNCNVLRERTKKNSQKKNICNDKIYEYKPLSKVFDELKSQALLSDDLLTYFRLLLVDNCGMNVRNRISHGLATAGEYDYVTADRIVHAFLALASLKEITNLKPN